MVIKRINELLPEKACEFLSIMCFCFGIWCIPFWYPFILQFLVDILLFVLNIDINTVLVRKFFVCVYSCLTVLVGLVLKKEEGWYMTLLSFLTIIVGLVSGIFLVFCV